ncbi:MAG: hypothetical protein WC433_01980 [Candidatus Omnitrophota bacterium]
MKPDIHQAHFGKFLLSVLDLKGRERKDFWFAVYKRVAKSNDGYTAPFPPGIDKTVFNTYILQVLSMEGGKYNAGTISGFLEKISKAFVEVARERAGNKRENSPS